MASVVWASQERNGLGIVYAGGSPASQIDLTGLFKTSVERPKSSLCGGFDVVLVHELQIPSRESVVLIQKICSPKFYGIDRCRIDGSLSPECGCSIYDSCGVEMPDENCHYEWLRAYGGKTRDEQQKRKQSEPNGCSSQGERYDTLSLRVFKMEDVAVELLEKFKYAALEIKVGCGFSYTAVGSNDRAFSREKPEFWDKVTPVVKHEVEIYVNWHCCFGQRNQFAAITSNGQPIWNLEEWHSWHSWT